MPYLLDVNILIALIDDRHVMHDRAHEWFDQTGGQQWLTCPITETGLVRILGNPKYGNGPIGPERTLASLNTLVARGNHGFIPDSVSLRDGALFDFQRLRNTRHLTDMYLLVLAHVHAAVLVTFDSRIDPGLAGLGHESLHLIL